jgi:hypothetical protein
VYGKKHNKKPWIGAVGEARDHHGEGLDLESGTYRCASCTMLEWWLGDVGRTAEKLRGEGLPLPRLNSIENAQEINELSDRYLSKAVKKKLGLPGKGWGSNPFGPDRPLTGRKGQKDPPERLFKRGAHRMVKEARRRERPPGAGGPLVRPCRKCGRLVGAAYELPAHGAR